VGTDLLAQSVFPAEHLVTGRLAIRKDQADIPVSNTFPIMGAPTKAVCEFPHINRFVFVRDIAEAGGKG